MRTIDADALRNRAKQAMLEIADTPLPNDYASKLAVKMGEMFQRLIDEAPTVDAEPVRHGRWIPCFEPVEVFVNPMCDSEILDVQTGWVCSECGLHGHCNTLDEMPYCHCGAKMGAEVKD